VGEHLILKLNPKNISLNLGRCAKLASIFCGPFEILEKIEPLVYMIALSASMNVHNVFHVYLLRKYVHDTNHVIDWHLI
jgi:hypothetical protein